ncbi:MAG: hypothetical protein M1412_08700 [Deltaproteobacteria bacterium]|nr:hypothetical protein [Deltaproteobacteria bacterium]MCL5893222.1 hypothetical protein [Deltaproteobacteria bacterium]
MPKESPIVSYLKYPAIDKILYGNPYPKNFSVALYKKFGVKREKIPYFVQRTERTVKSRLLSLKKSDKVNTLSTLTGVPKIKIIERVLRGNLGLNREDMLVYLMGVSDKLESDGVDNPNLRYEIIRLLKK